MLRSFRLPLFVAGCALGVAVGDRLNYSWRRDYQSRAAAAAQPITRGTGSPASISSTPDWWRRLELRDLQGAPAAPAGRWLVVVFLSPECPVANAQLPVLNALAHEFGPQGFAFAGAYADPDIGLDVLRRHAAESSLALLAVDDRAQRLAHAIGAKYTPEAFVFSADGAVLYRGRIDDRVEGFGAAKPKATHENLRDVLAALASGQPGPFPNQPGFGCSLPEPVKP